MKFLKIFPLVLLAVFVFAKVALAQEIAQAKGQSYSSRFNNEQDDGVMANLAKIKRSGIGYRFGDGSSFGVTIKNGIRFGINIRF